MSRLAVRAEIIKLGQALGRSPEQLAFLQVIPADDLRGLRTAWDDVLFEQYRLPLRHAAAILRWLPKSLAAVLIRWLFGPRLGARLAAALPARLAIEITPHLPDSFMVECARYVDPRRLRDAITLAPPATSLRILRLLLQHREYMTLGRILEHLADDNVRALAALVEDEEALVEIAFYMDSKNRLDHFLRLLPREHLRKAFQLLQDPSRRALWPKLMVLMMYANPALQRELIGLVAEQGEPVMNALAQTLHEEGLFADVIHLTAAASPDVQKMMANLPVMQRPGVVEHIVRAVDEDDAWGPHLVMLGWSPEEFQRRAAALLETLPRQTLERLAHAAMLGERWEPALDVVARLSEPRQREFADILRRYGEVDRELLARVKALAAQRGLNTLFS